MIFALILCSVISSPRLGQFFDLASWVPTSVSADRQFGSESATNMSRRVTEDTLAAVNSIFEGWCERCYYPSCGTNSAWHIAEWGMPVPNAAFRFDPPAAHSSTNTSPVRTPQFVYDADTNRVFRTRRLVEYDNLKALAGALRSPSYADIRLGGAEGLTETYRPTWPRTRRDASDYHSAYYDDPQVWWSSSAFDGFCDFSGDTGDIDPPTFSWTGPDDAATKCPHQWQQVWRRFVDTYPYTTDLLIDWSQGQYAYSREYSPRIPYQLFDAVDYNEFDTRHGVTDTTLAGYIHRFHMSSNTMDVLRSAFPGYTVSHVDDGPYGMTLDGRDLFAPAIVFTEWLSRQSFTNHAVRPTYVLLQVAFSGVPTSASMTSTGSASMKINLLSFAQVSNEDGTVPFSVMEFGGDSYDCYATASVPEKYSASDVESAVVERDPDFDFDWPVLYGYGVVYRLQWGSSDLPTATPIGWGRHIRDKFPPQILQEFPAHVADLTFRSPSTNYLCKIEEITNVTRRLVSAPVAGVSQVVSCLDRSYSLMRVPPFSVVTNFSAHSYLTGTADLKFDNVTVVESVGGVELVFSDDDADADPTSWKEFAATEFATGITVYASSFDNTRRDTMVAYASAVHEGISDSDVSAPGAVSETVHADLETMRERLIGMYPSVSYVDVMFDGVLAEAPEGGVRVELWGDFFPDPFSPGVEICITNGVAITSNDLVQASATFSRNYEFGWTPRLTDADFARHDVVWPGRYDGRIGAAKLWTLGSVADSGVSDSRDDSAYELGFAYLDFLDDRWNRESSAHQYFPVGTLYSSYVRDYTSVLTCTEAISDAAGDVYDECVAGLRRRAAAFDDPSVMIDPLCRRAVEHMQHLRVPKTVRFAVRPLTEVYVTGWDQTAMSNVVDLAVEPIAGFINQDGGWSDPIIPARFKLKGTDTQHTVACSALTVQTRLTCSSDDTPEYYGSDPYRSDRFRGAVSNGKVSGVHRVDWSFNALRRTSNKGTQP